MVSPRFENQSSSAAGVTPGSGRWSMVTRRRPCGADEYRTVAVSTVRIGYRTGTDADTTSTPKIRLRFFR
jgi:hypothetical protein